MMFNFFWNKGKKIILFLLVIVSIIFLTSCNINKKISYNPNQKISPNQLQYDFDLLQNVLEKEHPSLYWHTPKSIIDKSFADAMLQLKDSLNELQFRKIVSKVVALIKCGHTSVRGSKAFEKWISKADIAYFPIGMRTFKDTLVSTYNLYQKDTLLPRGTLIKSINNISSKRILDSMFQYISTDVNATNFKNIKISNNFPFYYTLVMDTAQQYNIIYLDSLGAEKSLTVTNYHQPIKGTTKKIKKKDLAKPIVKKPTKYFNIRHLEIDTINYNATITLNSFMGGKQKKFYRHTFKKLNQFGIKNLIIDLRNNGGGVINNSTLLTKYIVNKSFKVADIVFTKVRTSKYNSVIKKRFWYGLLTLFTTHKKSDGNYHFRTIEKKVYHPKIKNHFNGNVYAITGGYSFSATTLFLNNIKDQKNVTLVGEETGGGAYGNTAVFIPDLILPNSKLRIRMPVFRLIMNKNVTQTNQGIFPNYYVPPTLKSLKNGVDNKMEKVKELIKKTN